MSLTVIFLIVAVLATTLSAATTNPTEGVP
jgi:hypothetical protein